MRFNYGILGKDNQTTIYDYYFKILLSKLDSLFVWENLPEKIDKDFLNACLFLNGFCAFFNNDNNLYCNFGGLGGKPNENYYSTLFTLANPILGSKQYTIDDDCIIMYNTDSDKQLLNLAGTGGMYPLLHQTATLLTDNVQSINSAQINTRVQTVFTVENDRQKRTAEEFIKRQYQGEPFSVILQDELQPFEVKNIETDTDKTITNLLELHQYIIADFYNNIGITTTPYQKRERLVTDEILSIDNMTACTIDGMLKARQEGCEKVNNMFGTNISVRLADFLQAQQEKDQQTDSAGAGQQETPTEENEKETEEKETEETIKEGETD